LTKELSGSRVALHFFSILLFLAACSQSSSPFILRVTITSEPKVGAVIDYHASLKIVGRDLPNTTVRVEIHEAVEVVDGDPQWKGDLTEGETIEMDLKLRVLQPGEWEIQTRAESKPNPESSLTFGSLNRVLIISHYDSGQIIHYDELKETEMPCGADLNCGSPPAPPSRPLVTVTPTK
jgi:hypothetical protein